MINKEVNYVSSECDYLTIFYKNIKLGEACLLGERGGASHIFFIDSLN
jgi:hypothetical protein